MPYCRIVDTGRANSAADAALALGRPLNQVKEIEVLPPGFHRPRTLAPRKSEIGMRGTCTGFQADVRLSAPSKMHLLNGDHVSRGSPGQ
jgi:hypothetical protein